MKLRKTVVVAFVAMSVAVTVILVVRSPVFPRYTHVHVSDKVLTEKHPTAAVSTDSVVPRQRTTEPSIDSYTIVTALFDIGRSNWTTYKRSYREYLGFMEQLMALKANIIVFTDPEGAAAVRRMRRNQTNRTRIIEMTLKDLPYYSYRKRVNEIMHNEEFRRDNSLAKHGNPEANVPEYDIVMWSKAGLVDRAIVMDPFNTSYFMWFDAGYGHGRDLYPKDGKWVPRNLLEFPDTVTMIERNEGAEASRKDADRLYRTNIAVLVGSFFGGGKEPLRRLHALQQEVVADWMKRGITDDDQSSMLVVYFREPGLFHLVHGDWYDVFKLFH